jgi:Family of unknown function (DUF6521)
MTPAEIVQNDALGAVILWRAVDAYGHEAPSGMPLLLCGPVLSLVFQKESCDEIAKRQRLGGFFRLVSEKPAVIVGLEEQVQESVDQMWSSLNIAMAVGLVTFEASAKSLLAKPNGFSQRSAPTDVRHKLYAAERLGLWFASSGMAQTCDLLQLRM